MEELIVDENKFLASFSENQQNQVKKYLLAKKLYNSIKNVSEIARQVKHPNRTVSEWLVEGRVPCPIKSLNFLKRIGLMPLKLENNEKFCFFVELLAFIFGDGHLLKTLGSFRLFGQKEDLEKISALINACFLIRTKLEISKNASEITRVRKRVIYKNKPSGYCWRLEVNSSQLARLLYLAGAPVGDKVASPIKVPEWVWKGDKEIKRTFLSVLFGNELGCPSIRAQNAFTTPSFGLHKIESKEANLVEFLNQIKLLLSEFGILTSPILTEKCQTVRKDGNLSKKSSFYIDGQAPNILKLFKEIPFKYAEEKQRKFDNAVRQFLQKSQHLKSEWGLYEKVMQMHAGGLGRRRIFKQLKLPSRYFHNINAWIHYGRKPLYYGGKAEILEFSKL